MSVYTENSKQFAKKSKESVRVTCALAHSYSTCTSASDISASVPLH